MVQNQYRIRRITTRQVIRLLEFAAGYIPDRIMTAQEEAAERQLLSKLFPVDEPRKPKPTPGATAHHETPKPTIGATAHHETPKPTTTTKRQKRPRILSRYVRPAKKDIQPGFHPLGAAPLHSALEETWKVLHRAGIRAYTRLHWMVAELDRWDEAAKLAATVPGFHVSPRRSKAPKC